MCSLKLCTQQMDANGNVITMRQVSQDRYEFKQKATPIHLKSRRAHPRRHPINAQFLGTSWRLRRAPQCRKSLIHGGWVCCLWVASCYEGSPSAKHVRTHSRVDTKCRIFFKKKDMAALNKLLAFFIVDIWRESPLPYHYHIQEW